VQAASSETFLHPANGKIVTADFKRYGAKLGGWQVDVGLHDGQ
jgi:hypothetical protein